MKKFLMALAVLALVSAPALAGPNANGTLVVHDTGLVYTTDSTEYPSDAPMCENVDNQIDLGAFGVWKVYAAFPENASPRLKALVMGEQFNATTYVLAGGLPDPVNDFEITQNGWPLTSGGGVGISFGTVKTTLMVECYWLGGYSYGGSWAVAPHPTQAMVFVDDSVPPLEDPIVGLGSLGFGEAGFTPCPVGPQEGACCFADGSCQLLFADACLGAGGIVFGGPCDPNPCPPPPPEGACCFGPDCVITTQSLCIAQGGVWYDGPCDPNPCPPVPVEETTWGAIKANYR
jgi:hypothetical protein